MTIDITQHPLYSPAPPETYEAAWAIALNLYQHCDSQEAYDALLIVLSYLRDYEDGSATATLYGDAVSVARAAA